MNLFDADYNFALRFLLLHHIRTLPYTRSHTREDHGSEPVEQPQAVYSGVLVPELRVGPLKDPVTDPTEAQDTFL